MKNILITVLLCLIISASDAVAADIKGKAPGKPGSHVVVWIEGVKTAPAPKGHPSVSQRGTQFYPRILVVVAGQTVDMPNDDSVAHNVFSLSPGKQFNLGIYPKGESKTVTFTKPAVVEIFCSIHRQMSAKIIVVPNSYFDLASGGGQYLIRGVAAGTYTLKVWVEGGGTQSRQVTVGSSGVVTTDF